MPSPRFQRAALLLAMAALAPTLMPWSARALPDTEVEAKLDTVLMLMSVDQNGQPRAVNATINGQSVQAYLAAMSIAAAEEIQAGKRFAVAKEELPSLRFAPVSLSRFNQLLAPLLQKQPKEVGAIAPDPGQIDRTALLLKDQNIPEDKARAIAAQQPMIFCPVPGLLVNSSKGPKKDQPFVPCATELTIIDAIVQRGIKESPKLAEARPRVVAIPLNNFISYLRQEPAARVGQLRILPDSRLARLVVDLNSKAKAATPSTAPNPRSTPAAPPRPRTTPATP